jgi:hypothetical protein
MNDSVSKVIAAASEIAERRDARAAWVRKSCAAWEKAQQTMDWRCRNAALRLSEQDFEGLFEAEQAKVDALRMPLDLVAERGIWPRELYWGGV